MPQLEHFVLTNFNVNRDDCRRDGNRRPVDRNGAPMRTCEWLEHRFVVFERFCLPSLIAQTCLDFSWLMRYDEVGTPPEGLRRLRTYGAAFENLRLIPEPTSFRQAIASSVDLRGRRLLTTRLDSDDALHRTAIALLQRNAAGEELEFLSLPLGYCYSYPHGQVRLRRHVSNPFLSLAENGTGAPPRTAVYVSHDLAHEAAPVRQIAGQPMWLQVVHERNMRNRFRGERCAPPDLKEHFNVDAPANQATESARGASAGAPSM
jgi:Putative rhamnosyl transferase